MIPIVPWQPGETPSELTALLRRNQGRPPELIREVQTIIDRVRDGGDVAKQGGVDANQLGALLCY